MFQGEPKPLEHQSFVPDTHGPLEGVAANEVRSPNNCRYECSLGLLTKRFITLLHQSEDGFLDLNRVADVLKVQKRRIYDITNVLEGVGLIEKSLKNTVSRKGLDMLRPKELYDQNTVLKAQVATLCNEEHRLDDMIRDMQENLCRLTEEENSRKWLYLTKEDIKSIPEFQDDIVIAINAPHGTSIEVPDPCEGGKGADFPPNHYRMVLRSSLGPIRCYLISNDEEKNDASNRSHENATSSRTFGEGRQDPAMHQSSSDSAASQECSNGIVQIVPSNADTGSDYWLQSDISYRETDIWET
ncbi:transcription factor E2FB-like isoform X2 [Ananas comosus]|nr:transcription factor E2FB-like isoform X2 [Ananas comosus]